MMTTTPACSFDASEQQRKVRENLEVSRVNLILAGFPKCGTTSFAHWLGESAAISVSNPKETFLLCSEHRKQGTIAEEGSLERCFRNDQKPFRLEASTLNVYSQPLLTELEQQPGIKVILIYRDPVESVISWHNQVVQAGDAIAADIETCWNQSIELRHRERASGELDFSTLRLMQHYALVCEYGFWMQRWQDALGSERVLFVQAAELQGDCESLKVRLDHFLNSTLELPATPPVLNSYASIRFESFYKSFKRSSLNQRLRDIERAFPIAATVRRTMKEKFFRKRVQKADHATLKSAIADDYKDDIALAQHLFEQNQSHWLK